MALALALGGAKSIRWRRFRGALGELLADGVETVLAAFSLFMSPQIELTAAYGLGGLAVLAALFGSGLVRLSGQAAWRLLRGRGICDTARAPIRPCAAWSQHSIQTRSENRLPLRAAQPVMRLPHLRRAMILMRA